MQPNIKIKPWLTIDKMFVWLQGAPNESSYKRRLAVWLVYTGKISAAKVAEILGVSKQAVWLWLRQYNKTGPAGLERKGRGGRRRELISFEKETLLLKPFLQQLQSGQKVKPTAIRQALEKELGITLSMPYIYRLLQRHNWSETIAQSKQAGKPPQPAEDFKKISRPWLRNTNR